MKLSTLAQNWKSGQQNSYLTQHSTNFHDFLHFESGEPWFPLSANLERKLAKFTGQDLKRRPSIDASHLSAAAAEFWKINSSNVIAANGSDQLISLLPFLFMNPGDKALVVNPTFFLFTDAVQKAGGTILSLETSRTTRFEITDELLFQIIERCNKNRVKIIWLCNPNNPTGTAIGVDKIKLISENTRALVVVDEAFFELSDLTANQSAQTLLPNHPNILVLKSLSKTFGLSSVRLGFAFASQDIISVLKQWRLPFAVSGIAQEIGSLILRDIKHWEKMKQASLHEKNFLIGQIKMLKNIELPAISKTSIFLLKHKHKKVFNFLLAKKILTADFNQCEGIKNQGFVRITVKSRRENQQLLEVLKQIQ